MALNLNNFLNTLVDCLENYNNVTYTTPQEVQIYVYGKAYKSGKLSITLAGESERTLDVTEDTSLDNVIDWIKGFQTTNYSVESSNNLVKFTQKPKTREISDEYKNYGPVNIYSNLGQTSYDNGRTGFVIITTEQYGYECDFDQNMEYHELIGSKPVLDDDGKPTYDEEGNPITEPIYQTTTDTIRNVMIKSMEGFYQKIFDSILALKTTVSGVPAVAPVAGPVTATEMITTFPMNLTVFTTNLTSINCARMGSLSGIEKEKAFKCISAYATAFITWFTAQTYTVPEHSITPPTTASTYGYNYNGSNSGQVLLEFPDFNGLTLSSQIISNLVSMAEVSVKASGHMKPYMDLICSVLATHINDNWEYGFNAGGIHYTGAVLPSGSLTGANTSDVTNINR